MKQPASSPQLTITINPGTVYISTNPSQSSYADLAVTITNSGTDALTVKGITITLPAALAPASALQSINPAAGQANLWNFHPSPFTPGEFDASPASATTVPMKSGDSWSFTLKNVTLVHAITQTPANVTAAVYFADETNFPQNLPVNLAVATAGISFSADLPDISPGQLSKLSWQCKGIDYCILLPGDGQRFGAQDAKGVTPDSTTTYTLFAYGPGVILSAQFTITVENPQILSFNAVEGQSHIELNGYVTLEWRCNDFTDTIKIDANTSVTIPPLGNARQGNVSIGPLTAPTSFTLFAYAADKSIYSTLPADIGINDVTASITATPSTDLWVQDAITLSWDIKNANDVKLTPALENGPSLQNLSGSVIYNPGPGVASLQFALSVKGFEENIKKGITVQLPNALIFQPVTIDDFSISPAIISEVSGPNEATLTWSTHAQNVSINNIGAVDPAGSHVLTAPANGTVYTLSAGTNQHPALVTKQVQVVNARGPFTFVGLFEVETPHQSYAGIPVPELADLLNYITQPCSITVTGIMMGGIPVTQLSNTHILRSPGGYLSFTFPPTGQIDWIDRNNPSGVVTIIGE